MSSGDGMAALRGGCDCGVDVWMGGGVGRRCGCGAPSMGIGWRREYRMQRRRRWVEASMGGMEATAWVMKGMGVVTLGGMVWMGESATVLLGLAAATSMLVLRLRGRCG